ncbi:hypothetical protein F2P58_22765 [Vibrio fortis]|uniref:Uncharacterized protein n=1 Tax=Vibrio fortis TaxID=212667 RepID=A0A5N3QT19_9VIBR|nr:hypothetical protein [Vibrio fortis]KAB0285346.1 hypothetical protein F2P58_22765 [Vibrio fortis]
MTTRYFVFFPLAALIVCCFVYFDFDDEVKEEIIPVVQIRTESITDNISNNADYPIPVVKLQKLVTSVLIEELSEKEILAEYEINSTANSLSDHSEAIDALQQRLNKLKNDNN